MSIDSFLGSESVDGAISADKVKEFQDRMARNAAAMAAARQQEQKQKKKEDRLAAILLRFIQTSARSDLVLLVARCLEQNIPAVFVLSVILLGNDAMQKEMGVELHLLGGGHRPESTPGSAPVGALPAGESISLEAAPPTDDTNKMVPFGENGAISLKLRIEIELWTQAMWEAIAPIPERIFKTAVEYQEDADAVPEPKAVVVQLAAFVLRDFFQVQHVDQPFENLKAFGEFVIKGLFTRLKEQIADQKQLGGQEA